MIDPKDVERLNQEIDGMNSPVESAALKERMAIDPALQRRYDDLGRLARTLSDVAGVSPSPELAAEVMWSIRQQPSRTRESWLETMRSLFGRRPALRYALTFACGLALGAVMAGFANPSRLFLEGSDLSGTVLPDSRLGRMQEIDRIPFDLEGVRGEASTRAGGELVVAEVRIDSPRPLELTIDFDGSALSPVGFDRSASSKGDVSLGPDRLRVQHTGEGRYRLALGVGKAPSPPLRLTLRGDGVRLERMLETKRHKP